MRYLYYPGCSLKSTGRPYEESLLAVFEALGVHVTELHDWNCCGATSYMSVDETRAYALAARNLALAEEGNPDGEVQLIAPCSACYLVHAKVQEAMSSNSPRAHIVKEALFATGLVYQGRVRLRHPLDVLVNDVGLDRIRAAATRPLEGLKVACYYGCQIVRPFPAVGSGRHPEMMDELMRAAGAETVEWPLKTRCCGGSLTGTLEEVGLRMSQLILREAVKRGADVVATACPLCQFNLESYHDRMRRMFGEPVDRPVAYFTQLLGRAMGIPDRALGLQRMLVPVQPQSAGA